MVQLPEWARQVNESNHRFIFISGGRSSSKSHSVATIEVIKHLENPDLKTVCIREVQKSIKFSSKQLIQNKIQASGFASRFDIQNDVIYSKTGTGIFLFTGMQDHTADSIKSLEGMNRAWVEEAQRLSKRSLDILIPTIREAGSQIVFTWNPQDEYDPIDTLCRELKTNRPDDVIHIHVNYVDNPFLSEESRKDAEHWRVNKSDEYGHIWLGEYRKQDENSFIKANVLRSCVNAGARLGIVSSGVRVLGLDVADDNTNEDGSKRESDKSASAVRHGFSLIHVSEWDGMNTTKTADKAQKIAEQYGADRIIYDSIGVGAGVRARYDETRASRNIRADGFNAGASVIDPDGEMIKGKKNKDMFDNAKAQAWWQLRDRAEYTHSMIKKREKGESEPIDENRLLSLDCENVDQLIRELSSPRLEYTNNGKVKVESKKDLAKRSVKSPNLADATVMAFLNIRRAYDHLL